MEIALVKKNLKEFMINHLLVNQGFAARFFYAPAYALAWFSREGDLTSEVKKKLMDNYSSLDQAASNFHFEFNHFALLDYREKTSDPSFDQQLKTLKFRGTNCTNWRLLKLVVELKSGRNSSDILNEAFVLMNERQLASGFILDEPQVRSFQYHAFSMSLLGDIYRLTDDQKIKNNFLRAAEFISHFILPNGEVFYIGRGQYQIFGIGPLLLSLLQAYEFTHDKKYLDDFYRCFQYLKHNQYSDGRFPLVLTNEQEPLNAQSALQDKNCWGWYGYNNLFDYLALLGFYLNLVEEKVQQLNIANATTITQKKMTAYHDSDFQIEVQAEYTAIISRPGGAWSNDLPLPIIFSHKSNKTITPCYGGEQYLPSLNRIEGVAYPSSGKTSIRKYGRGILLKDSWIWFSVQGVFKRKFHFKSNYMTIMDHYLSPWKIRDHLLLFQDAELLSPMHLQTPDLEIFSPSSLVEGETEYSASGPLKSYWTDSCLKHWVVKIR